MNILDINDSKAVYAMASASPRTSVTGSTETVINYQNATIDSDSAITTGASWVFTAPRDGIYHVSVVFVPLYAVKANNEQVTGRLRKNGTAFVTAEESITIAFASPGESRTFIVSGSVELAASDTIDATIQTQLSGLQSCGGNISIHNILKGAA